VYSQDDEETVAWLNAVRQGSDKEAYEALQQLCVRCSRSLDPSEEQPAAAAEDAEELQLEAGGEAGGAGGSNGGRASSSDAADATGGSDAKAGPASRSGTDRGASGGRGGTGSAAGAAARALDDVPPHRLFGTNGESDQLTDAQQKLLTGKPVRRAAARDILYAWVAWVAQPPPRAFPGVVSRVHCTHTQAHTVTRCTL
jgi:hypothetical protein